MLEFVEEEFAEKVSSMLHWVVRLDRLRRLHRLAWLDRFGRLHRIAWLDRLRRLHRLAWLDRLGRLHWVVRLDRLAWLAGSTLNALIALARITRWAFAATRPLFVRPCIWKIASIKKH